MITEYMTLTTKADAHIWAQTYNLTTRQTDLLTHWIWIKKPSSGCTFAEHPLSSISDYDFYELVEGRVSNRVRLEGFGANIDRAEFD